MKKLLTIITAAALVLSLSACSGNAETDKTKTVAKMNDIEISESKVDDFMKCREAWAKIADETTSELIEEMNFTDKDYGRVSKHQAIDLLVEDAYFVTEYCTVTYEEAQKVIKEQFEQNKKLSDQYENAKNAMELIEKYYTSLGFSEEEYLDRSAEDYRVWTSKINAKKAFSEKSGIAVEDENFENEFNDFVKSEISKKAVFFENIDK